MKTNKIRNTMLHRVQHNVSVAQPATIFECPILFSDCTDIPWSQTPLSSKRPNAVTVQRDPLTDSTSEKIICFHPKGRPSFLFVTYPFSHPNYFYQTDRTNSWENDSNDNTSLQKELCNSPHFQSLINTYGSTCLKEILSGLSWENGIPP